MKLRHFMFKWLAMAITLAMFLEFALTTPPAQAQPLPIIGNQPVFNSQVETLPALENVPLMFIENVGQIDSQVRYVAHGSDASIFITDRSIWFSFSEHKEDVLSESIEDVIEQHFLKDLQKITKVVNLQITFPVANSSLQIETFDQMDVQVSQFTGERFATQFNDVPVWGGIRFSEFYPGADLELTTSEGALVWRIIVKDASKLMSDSYVSAHGLSIKVAGYQQMGILDGALNVKTEIGDYVFPRFQLQGEVDENIFGVTPRIIGDEIFILYPETSLYAKDNADLKTLASSAKLKNAILQNTGDNPNLLFAALYGGAGEDSAEGQAIGIDGSIYVVGETASLGFPSTPGAYDVTLSGSMDAFVLKINTDGNLAYMTYIGGNDWDAGNAIAVNQNGEAYVAGETSSSGFLAKISADGSQLLYSSVIDAHAVGVALDADENVYVLGNKFDRLAWAWKGIAYKLQPGNANYDYTYSLGNGLWNSMAVDANGYAYFAGDSRTSPSFVLAAAITDIGAPVYSIVIGQGRGFGVAVDANGFAYITGNGYSANFPVVGTPVATTSGAFVTIINPAGVIAYSSLLGVGMGNAIAVDSQGFIYIIGTTGWNFPSTDGAIWKRTEVSSYIDAYIIKLRPETIRQKYVISYATAIGGSYYSYTQSFVGTIDAAGNVYVTGSTAAPDFVGTSGTVDYDYQAFVVKIATGGGYDCTGTPLTDIGQAVYDVVGDQNYCKNQVVGLIETPKNALTVPPDPNVNTLDAYEEFAKLIREAQYEIDFTTMIWQNSDQATAILEGVRDLYFKVRDNAAEKYLKGVTVRILLGYQYGPEDQRETVLKKLHEFNVPDSALNWRIEVAAYRDSFSSPINGVPPILGTPIQGFLPLFGIHSHVKMLVVDGHELIVTGYNVDAGYAGKFATTDMGLHVSGPIAQNALDTFDKLWAKARCINPCPTINIAPDSVSHLPEIKTILPSGETNVFSLYRDNDEKGADKAVKAALSETTQRAYILQNRYFQDAQYVIPSVDFPYFKTIWLPPAPYPNPESGANGVMDYTEGILNALKNGADITLVLSGNRIPGSEGPLSAISIWNLLRLKTDKGITTGSLCVKMTPTYLHAKSMSFDDQFLIVGSQNFDFSSHGSYGGNNGQLGFDLAEYALGTEDSNAVNAFNARFAFESVRSGFLYFASPLSLPPPFIAKSVCNEDSASVAQTSKMVNFAGLQTTVMEKIFTSPFELSMLSVVKDFEPALFTPSASTTAVASPETIQATIDQAAPGSYIALTPGSYAESVIINKPITLFAFRPDLTIIKPPAASPAFYVTSGNVSITNLTVRGSGGYGVEIRNSSASNFENIHIGNIVFENNASGGVLLSGTGGIQYALENNTFVGGAYGVVSKTNTTATIRNNIFIGQSSAPIRVSSAGDSQVEYSYNLFSICGSNLDCATRWRIGSASLAGNPHDNLFNLDPQFMNPTLGNYTLSPTSPLIDAGDSNTAASNEYNGVFRIDIGAFESSFMEQPPSSTDDVPNLPGIITESTSVNVNLRYYINPTGDEDWFRFYLPKAGNPQVYLTNLPTNYDLYVYNAAGQLVGSSTKDKKSAEKVKIINPVCKERENDNRSCNIESEHEAKAMSGYYYIRVVGVNGAWSVNPYQLRINTAEDR